jgi:hypothetical protein
VGTHPLPDGLLAVPGQRQVDAVQRHPVNFLLPAGPVPPYKRIALRAHILVIAVPASRSTLLWAERMPSTPEGPFVWKTSETTWP